MPNLTTITKQYTFYKSLQLSDGEDSFFRMLTDNVGLFGENNLVYVLNVSTLQYEYVSPNLFQLLGYESSLFEEGGLTSTLNMVPSSFRETVITTEKKFYDYLHEQPFWELPHICKKHIFPVVHANGETRWLLMMGRPFCLDICDQPLLVAGMITDISNLNQHYSISCSLENKGKTIQLYPSAQTIVKSSKLTVREKEILKLLGSGHSSKEIAVLLFISKGTVDQHRKNIIRKTGARNIAEVIGRINKL
jgi:DNA-binding CsgD family transcriptional regulator